jgi:uncharacterized protein
MADNANVELLRKGYDAFMKGDMETLNTVFADDIVFRFLGRNPLSGEYTPKQKVFEFFGQLAERTGGTFAVEPLNISGEDDKVVVVGRWTGERNGKTLDGIYTQLWRVQNGKAVESQVFYADQYQVDDFWS